MTFAQCGDGRTYPWGDQWPPKYGNFKGEEARGLDPFGGGLVIKGYRDGAVVTCSVERSGRNDWGLFGVGGNMLECTLKNESLTELDAWRGAWFFSDRQGSLSCECRFASNASNRDRNYGFRLVLSRRGPK